MSTTDFIDETYDTAFTLQKTWQQPESTIINNAEDCVIFPYNGVLKGLTECRKVSQKDLLLFHLSHPNQELLSWTKTKLQINF
ncbi:hypothetical protein J6590_101842 [Homalodisca vitripennis]|nr:hypothetical protein J6590_101842 [Homalodisca vitripennis]